MLIALAVAAYLGLGFTAILTYAKKSSHALTGNEVLAGTFVWPFFLMAAGLNWLGSQIGKLL